MLTTIAAIAVLLVLSAFFSGSETALTATSRPLMHQLEKKGSRRARMVNRLIEHKDNLIGAILLGNNLVNILASALATSALIELFGEAGIAYATFLMTALVVLFAEILPKTYALQNAERTALAIAPVIRPAVAFFSPVTRATQAVVRGALWLFGVRLQAGPALGSESEELRGAIELHRGDARVTGRERAMLRSVLDLAEVEVGEIMVHRNTIAAVNAGEPLEKIVEQVLDSPFTRLPLWLNEADNIVGVLHTKELLRAVQGKPEADAEIEVERLAAAPWFVPESTRLLDQLQAFRDRHEHFALVVDEYGSLQGVVTLEDILEEIVGDITDEHDISVPGLRPQPDGTYIVDGKFTLRDINRELEWNLPDDTASTVAGLVLHQARRIPERGQSFRFHGFRFEILRRQRNQITTVRITPPPAETETAAADDDPDP